MCLVGLVLCAACTTSPTVNLTETPTTTPVLFTSEPVVPPTATFMMATAAADWEYDPVAVDVVGLAKRDLGTRLALAPETIQVESLTTVTWPDTSLGCPQDGRDYETVDVPGYRVVLQAEDDIHIYHADFSTTIYCDAEDEVLPE